MMPRYRFRVNDFRSVPTEIFVDAEKVVDACEEARKMAPKGASIEFKGTDDEPPSRTLRDVRFPDERVDK
jgi:hypothetical protein